MEDMFNFGKFDRKQKEEMLKALNDDLAKPVVTESVVTEPVVTEPVVTEPVITEPVITEPVVTEPVVTPEPVVIPEPVHYITSADLDRVVLEFTETIKKLTTKERENVKEKKYKY